ncbi:Suppressor of the cold-sensitive snRNP biogenesis mutant brr1-1 [Hypoxylon texense]
MVVRTTSLNSLKNFFPKIHQPLPLTNHESRQLLESITTSFRKNLDKEHPWEPSSIDESASPGSAAPRSRNPLLLKQTSHSPSLDASKRQPVADRHLRTILSNPLFTHQDAKKGPADPLDVFDLAVSRGLMTPRRAAGFLSKVRSGVRGASADEVRQGMARSGAGRKVLQWLRASGLENDLQFLLVSQLPSLLIPFMSAEGLEEIAWGWVARLAPRDGAQAMKWHHDALKALLHSIRKHSSTSYSGSKLSLDRAYEALIRADEVLPKKNEVARRSLEHVWFSLSWISTVLAAERPKPSAPLFESFVDIGRPLGAPLDMAHLELHHPLSPSHTAAVQFMHANAERQHEHQDLALRRRLVCLALDAANRLKQVGDTYEASWVERFLTRIGADGNLSIFMDQIRQASMPSQVPIRRMRYDI